MVHKTSDKTSKPEKPRGKDKVMKALIEAANELFGQKGPDAVSVRDIAATAGVNHALLHRHFGSKGKLLEAVMKDHANAFIAVSKTSSDPGLVSELMYNILAERPALIKIIAQLILTDHKPNDFVIAGGGHSVLTDLLAHSPSNKHTIKDAQMRAAAVSSLMLGWHMFAPFITSAVNTEITDEDMDVFIKETIKNILS